MKTGHTETRKTFQLRFHHADPAGILFFGALFPLAHEAFEDHLQQTCGITWQEWFQNPKAPTPIRRAEADYFSPMFPGQRYEARVKIVEVKESSFTVSCQFWSESTLCAEVKTVHVCIDPINKTKQSLPEHLKAKLAI